MPSSAKAASTSGLFVAIVGPSGAGKDALIRGLAGRLGEADGVYFARRVITRPADAYEEHDTLDEAEFLAARAAGRFVLAWTAHGLHYGVPREIEARLAAGDAVVCNLSRAIVGELRRLYPSSLVVLVTAQPATLAARLAGRGRDDASSRRERLDRSAAAEVVCTPDATIDNDGALDDAVARLAELVARRRSGAC